MQPVYRFPGKAVEAHLAKLEATNAVKNVPSSLYALLFLSGLWVAFSYIKHLDNEGEAWKEEQFTRCEPPQHHLDDKLVETARRCLKALMRAANSHSMKKTLALLKQHIPNKPPKWTSLSLSLNDDFFANCPPTVRKWVFQGDPRENKARLCIAMGIQSLFGTEHAGFTIQTIRETVPVDAEVASLIRAFVLTPDIALPEL